LETQTTAGIGKFNVSGLGSSGAAKEAVKVAFDYFKANVSRVSGAANAGDHHYHLHTIELHDTGATKAMTLPSFVALCSGVLQKPLQSQMVVLGDMSLGGSIIPVENLAECLAVAFDSGAKRNLLPMAGVVDIPSVPRELFAKFQTSLLRGSGGCGVQGAGSGVRAGLFGCLAGDQSWTRTGPWATTHALMRKGAALLCLSMPSMSPPGTQSGTNGASHR